MSIRQRSRSDSAAPSDAQITWRWTEYNQSTWTTNVAAPVTCPGFSTLESCEDIVTPNYRELISQGTIINNRFSKTKTVTVTPGPVTFMRYVAWKRLPYNGLVDLEAYEASGTLLPPCASNPAYGVLPESTSNVTSLISASESKAVTAAFANVDTSEMLALATAAESRKTIGSMVDISRRVLRLAKAARTLNLAALRNEITPKELSQRYLELRYAVRPMVYDAVGLIRAIEKPREHIRKTFRGYGSEQSQVSDTLSEVPIGASVYGSLKRTCNTFVSSRAGVLTDVEVSALTAFGVDLIAETAWELVPYSFIIDWFANVGDTIAAWTPNAGVRQLASWVTTKCLTSSLNSLVPGSAHVLFECDEANISFANFTYGTISETITRTPEPSLSVFPSVDMHLDAFKLIDLGLILRQSLK